MLAAVSEIADELNIRYSKLPPPEWTAEYTESSSNDVEMATSPFIELPNGGSRAKVDDDKSSFEVHHRDGEQKKST